MFTGSLTPTQIEGLYQIVKEYQEDEPSFLRHSNVLESVELTWFQCMCVEHALQSHGSICSLGTGLGKTAASAGYMKNVLKDNPETIGLFICLPESVEQIQEDYTNYLGIDVPCFTGEKSSLYFLSQIHDSRYSVLVLSSQALYTVEFANWFVRMRSKISCIVLDEAHMYSQESIINSILRQICTQVEFKLFLTATPITVSPTQVITLLNMLDPFFIPNGNDILKPYEIRDKETFELIDYKPLDSISNSIYLRYISWTRAELGLQGEYVPHVLMVTPTEEQMNCNMTEIETIIKGQEDSNQTKVLKAIILDEKSKNHKGLIYCNTRANSDMLERLLRRAGVKAFVANGDPKNKRLRRGIIEAFHNREIDVIITNLTTSLNLDCDYLVFWENTNKAVQMLGRCERGFLPKRLDIYFIFTENTVEVPQFSKNVYRRCKWLFEALGKDTEIFLRVQKAIETYNREES